MIKYNDNNIYVGYIKELLHTFNLPTCQIEKEGNKYFEGEYFINAKKDAICRVNSINSDGSIEDFEWIHEYKFGDNILNITKNLDIKNNYYDSYTHRYLGKYLRFIKDFTGVNLMSLYNCFSNDTPISYTNDVDGHEISTSDKRTTLFMVDVRPDTTYTISLECGSSVSVFCDFYGYNAELELEGVDYHLVQHGGNRFRHPFTYTTPSISVNNCMFRDNFKMFIVVPSAFIDNIVVLEGDYTRCTELLFEENNRVVMGSRIPDYDFEHVDEEQEESLEEFNQYFKDSLISSRLQLLSYATETKYLLADRLVEYLSDNAITPNDEIANNIKRVQMQILGNDSNFTFPMFGQWNDSILRWVYRYISNHGNKGDLTYRDIYTDLLGYVDKDSEIVLENLNIEGDKLRQERIEEIKEELGGYYHG